MTRKQTIACMLPLAVFQIADEIVVLITGDSKPPCQLQVIGWAVSYLVLSVSLYQNNWRNK